tara:strand:- start:182 stop:1126 length:945 start_codon:yes stop_codon:yes gene_type:complete
MPTQIDIKGVNKKFGKHHILKDVHLEIPAQKIFGIIGESGSGKTTLLKTIIGFWHTESGEISYEGRNLHKNPKFIKQIVGFATQEDAVYPKLTIKENLEYFGTLSNVPGKTLRSNIDKVIEFVHLTDAANTVAENLSGGMRRRLDIACALIHNPRILILDEPTEDLDPLLRRDILALIKRINTDQTTVILTSHLLHEAEVLCDEIAILHEGKIIQKGSPDEIKDSYSKDEEIKLVTASKEYRKLAKHLPKKGISKIEIGKKRMIIRTKDAEPVLNHLLKIIHHSKDKILEVDVNKPSLMEVFSNLIEGKRKKRG